MLWLMASLTGYAIQASDGRIGTVKDFLFDDSNWHLRWMVIGTGNLLTRRRILLVHLHMIDHVDHENRVLIVRLTAAQVEASPDILLDEPVSRQIEYGAQMPTDWNPDWGNPRYIAGPWGGMGICVSQERLDEEKSMHKAPRDGSQRDNGDPHLRSVSAVVGNHVHATDGDFGHIEDFYVESTTWEIRYIIVDTLNWWPGRHVLMLPASVREISWPHQEVEVSVSLQSLRDNPTWNPGEVRERAADNEDPSTSLKDTL